jgi:hypothetical protein
MATNLALDQDWLDHAFRVSGEPTNKAAVTRDQQDHIAAADSRNLCRRRGSRSAASMPYSFSLASGLS